LAGLDSSGAVNGANDANDASAEAAAAADPQSPDTEDFLEWYTASRPSYSVMSRAAMNLALRNYAEEASAAAPPRALQPQAGTGRRHAWYKTIWPALRAPWRARKNAAHGDLGANDPASGDTGTYADADAAAGPEAWTGYAPFNRRHAPSALDDILTGTRG